MKTLTKEQLDADTLFAFQMALKGHGQFEFRTSRGNWYKSTTISNHAPHRIYHDIPEGWTRHDGEDWKGDRDAVMSEIMFCDGRIEKEIMTNAEYFRAVGENSFTHHDHVYRIYAYKLAEKKREIPEGFIPWSGGERPVSKGENVQVIFRDPPHTAYTHCSERLRWSHQSLGGDIIAYRAIEKKVIPWNQDTCPRLPFEVRHKASRSRHTVTNACIAGCVITGHSQNYGNISSWETLNELFTTHEGHPCGTEVEQ